MIHEALPLVKTIGCYARITNVASKTDAELEALAESDGDTLAGDGAIAADIATRIGNEVFPNEEDEEDDE